MRKDSAAPAIRLRGVRHNNLKNFDLDLPLVKLIVITGLSGSGKSSLAFDTLFAEGQRRYIETFSPYARQFFDRMDKPQVDSIEGIPPAIAIEQRNTVRTTRSTVGTMTEICDYMKLLWPHLSQLFCRQCGRLVRQDTPQSIWDQLRVAGGLRAGKGGDWIVAFKLGLSDKLSLEESVGLVVKQGYQRILLPPDGGGVALREASAPVVRVAEENATGLEVSRIEETLDRLRTLKSSALIIVQDRLKLEPSNRARFMEACEQAYHFGKGQLAIYRMAPAGWGRGLMTTERFCFSNRFHCAGCDLEYREPTAALFSFNHPLGACPTCHGFGRLITIDYDRAIPDRSRTLAEGAVKPWLTGQGAECQEDLLKFCKRRKAPVDVPFKDLPLEIQDWVINGDSDYGTDARHEWPHAWYGVKGYFRWLESKAYKMHVRVLLSRYRAYSTCPNCQGKRFQPESLLYKVMGDAEAAPGLTRALTLADFYQLPIRDANRVIKELAERYSESGSHPLRLALNEVESRLGYMVEVGLGYLTLDRPTRSLSGGETERVNLTACLGTRLVNTLYVLDEPTVGLHARDTGRLVRVLERLRDAGNTVIVVEHEPGVMRSADLLVDLGPGHGETGGEIVFKGTYSEMIQSSRSLTGQYLSGRNRLEPGSRRPVNRSGALPELRITGACRHNLKNLTVEIPLQRFVCVTGVSGSGKSTLIREVLWPELEGRLKGKAPVARTNAMEAREQRDSDEPQSGANCGAIITGWERLSRAVLVDQSGLSKTPRSNPAVYSGAFDAIRELFAQSELARQRGLSASAFSFNSAQGQCERCRGAGFEKIEMQFLSDVYIRCPVCNGRRYRDHILEVTLTAKSERLGERTRNIAQLLEATVEEALLFLAEFREFRAAQRAVGRLAILQEVGLGYLRLGQPLNTLSGGESQRLKLAGHLVEFAEVQTSDRKPTLFLFDEPTTGLHFHDIGILLRVFQKLVSAGHSLIVIEHNLDVIWAADWLIDLGPEAGEEGGELVFEGTPEELVDCPESRTGEMLRSQHALQIHRECRNGA